MMDYRSCDLFFVAMDWLSEMILSGLMQERAYLTGKKQITRERS
jgi:hypothetical protein